MNIQDNVLKAYLKNVYFITGTHLGGKTTVSRILAERHHIPVYDMDERFPFHQQLSDPEHQPAMNQQFRDADEFFGRSVEEYRSWLIHNTREQLDFILLDLVRAAADHPVICDCHLTLEQADRMTDPSRIVYLIREPKDNVEEYCARPDHQPFSRWIHSATDYEQAKATCDKTLYTLNKDMYDNVKHSKYFWLERDPARTVEETVALVEKHFGLTE